MLRGAENLLFIGIGNVLKSDDGVGVEISNHLLDRGKIRSLTVEVSIENYIGKINSMAPERIVLVDCMDIGSSPGSYRLMSLENVEDQTFNTHNISLGRFGEFIPFPTYILGIQPQTLEFGDRLSPTVQHTADKLIQLINQITE